MKYLSGALPLPAVAPGAVAARIRAVTQEPSEKLAAFDACVEPFDSN
jgi:hypothetical protein